MAANKRHVETMVTASMTISLCHDQCARRVMSQTPPTVTVAKRWNTFAGSSKKTKPNTKIFVIVRA